MTLQSIVLATSLVLMMLIAAIFISAIRAASRPASAPPSEKSRSALIWGLLAIGVLVSVVSLNPYPHSITADGKLAETVNVTGYQWYWELDRDSVPLDVPVVFNAHAGDVTHGFGVTNAEGRMLFQTQAIPGYINKVEYVFTEPGTYQIVCLEYCGLAHHDMRSEFTVASGT